MTPYEREYFVARIRSGIYRLKLGQIVIKVLTPTMEDELIANEVFMESFDEARNDDIMTEDEMYEWMIEREIWSTEKDDKIEGIQKDIEKLKVEIFNNRYKSDIVTAIRKYLRAAEKALVKLTSEKTELFSKTCEGLAIQDKVMTLFSRCCYIGGEPLDIESVELSSLYYNYNKQLLDEKTLRELARNDPWRMHWISKDYCNLFSNENGRQLSQDQKGILIWSTMYDNIHESMDCPTEEVINDDDMLDGWFITQKKKNDSEKAKAEIERRTNEKIANSDEIMVMSSSKKEVESVHSMNSVHTEKIRQQRLQTVKSQGGAKDLDFKDRKIEMQTEINRRFKETRGR